MLLIPLRFDSENNSAILSSIIMHSPIRDDVGNINWLNRSIAELYMEVLDVIIGNMHVFLVEEWPICWLGNNK